MNGTAAGDGLRVGRFLGVPVYANPSLFITAGLLALAFVPLVEDFDPGIGSGKYLVAFGFAALLYLSILVHELAHAAAARGFGLPVRSITLYMLGGVTALERPAGTPGREFLVSAAGPAATLVLTGLGWLGLSLTTAGSVGQLLLFQVTMANLFVGVYNLLPGLPLDGGSMLAAIVWRVTGRELTGTLVAGWTGRAVAIATFALPVLLPWLAGRAPDPFLVVWGAIIGFFLWSGSTQALRSAVVRSRLPRLTVLGLVRPALPVAVDVPLAEALRQLAESGARALVVTDTQGRPTGLVSEAAVAATPSARRPWVPVGDVARRLEPELVVQADLVGEDLLTALRRAPATEYLVVEADGGIRGVLATSDVEAALSHP